MIAVTRLAMSSDPRNVLSQQAARRLGCCQPDVMEPSFYAVLADGVCCARVFITPRPPQAGALIRSSHIMRGLCAMVLRYGARRQATGGLKSLAASLAAQAHGTACARIICTMRNGRVAALQKVRFARCYSPPGGSAKRSDERHSRPHVPNRPSVWKGRLWASWAGDTLSINWGRSTD